MTTIAEFTKEFANYTVPSHCGVLCQINHTEGAYPFHRHDYLEFEYISQGSIEHELNGVKTVLTAGDFYCLDRRDLHRFTVLEPVLIHNICIRYKEASSAIQKLTSSVSFPIIGRFPPERLELMNIWFSNLNKNICEKSPYSKPRIEAFLTLILSELFEHGRAVSEKHASSGYSHITSAIEYMSANFSSEITLKDVASHVYLSETYFSKLFAEISGTTFLSYLADLRIDNAKNMLSTTNRPITLIAFDCGFSSFSTFSRIFKKQCGCTPTEFRRQARIIVP